MEINRPYVYLSATEELQKFTLSCAISAEKGTSFSRLLKVSDEPGSDVTIFHALMVTDDSTGQIASHSVSFDNNSYSALHQFVVQVLINGSFTGNKTIIRTADADEGG